MQILHCNGLFRFAVRRRRLNGNGTTIEFVVEALLLNKLMLVTCRSIIWSILYILVGRGGRKRCTCAVCFNT